MSDGLNEKDEALVELIHFLVTRSDLPVSKVKAFLATKVSNSNMTVMQHLESEGRAFVNRLKIFINQSED